MKASVDSWEALRGGRGPTLLAAQRLSGSLAMACAFGACAISGELGPALILVGAATVVFADRFARWQAGRLSWAWTVFLVLALAVFLLQAALGQLDFVLAAVRFVFLLGVHRLCHRRDQKDEHWLFLISLLLLCGAAALTGALLFGVFFVLYAVAATWAAAFSHLRFEIEDGRGPEGAAALLQSRRVVTAGFLAGLAAMSLAGLVGAASIFAIFPRVTLGGFRRSAPGQRIAGLSDRVDLRGHGTIADDPRVVLRAWLTPDPGTAKVSLHWRAHAFPMWTGSGWQGVPERTMAAHGPEAPRGLPGQPAWKSANVLAEIETVGGLSDGLVFSLPGRLLYVEADTQESARGSRHQILRDAQTEDLSFIPVDEGDFRYRIWTDVAQPSPAWLRGRGNRYPSEVRLNLQVPRAIDPRIVQLAHRLTDGKDPADATAAVESYLSRTYGYTRELAGDVADPLADFLFQRKKGHCELFSTAMVILLRIAGIPARNVTGYYGGVRTRVGYYAVRAGDAHSWVEVFFPGFGFATFDPTPAQGRGGEESGLQASLVLTWDQIEARWRAFVVDYDFRSQLKALQQIGAGLDQMRRRLAGRDGPRSAAWTQSWRTLAGGAVLVAAAALGSSLFKRRRRSRRGGAPLSADELRAVRLWRSAREQLQRAGVPLAKGALPQEVLAQARQLQRPEATALSTLIEAYSRARWGGAPLSAAAAAAALQRMREATRRESP